MKEQQEAVRQDEEKKYPPSPIMICRASSFRPAEKEQKKHWSLRLKERIKHWLGIN